MAHNPVNHPLRPLYRVIGFLAGAYLVVFGIVGLIQTSGEPFTGANDKTVLGQGGNLLLSIIMLAVGAIVVLATVIGRNVDTAVDKYLGWGLLVLGTFGLAFSRTDANIFGDPNAPVTIVEFADLQCPSCRSEFPKIKELVSSYKGKVRWIFRHYPLTNEHPLALTGAAMAEFAATKGKFFDFVTAVYNADPESLKSADDLLKIAESVGLSPTEVRAQVTDESSVAFNRVSRDVQAASVYGLVWTPTFFIFSTGNETKPDVAVGDEVQEVLKLKKYQQAMGNAGQ